MNQQMTMLEARAVAREREHQRTPRTVAARHRHIGRRSVWPSLGRQRSARAGAGRASGVLPARG